MLNSIVVKYVISLRHFTDQADDTHHFESELKSAKIVLSDFKTFLDFFMDHSDQLKKGGLRGEFPSALEEEMKPIKMLARIIGANHMSSVKADLEYFFERWGEDGLYIIKSAIKLNPTMSKADKKENDAFVQKTYTKQVSTSEAITGAISNAFKSADLLISTLTKKGKNNKKLKATKLSSYFKRA